MKILLTLFVIVIMSNSVDAQWSVLENDPRLGKNKDPGYLYQAFTTEEWNASSFAKPEEMKWFNDARYGMFIHFGLNSYVNKDMSWPIVYNRKAPDQGHGTYPDTAWQKTWPSLFKLEKFNAEEWVKIAQNAGMKYIVVIAKHHDGFHMWDTQYSDFKITNTPFKRDYIKEIIDACHKAKMPIGIYYSQRDWYHPDYAPVDPTKIKQKTNPPSKTAIMGASHPKYISYQFNVVKELLTKYGKIDIFWFDAAYWGGMFTADMWDSEKLTRMIRQLQPGIIINNRASVPGDFDTPEQRIGMYQKRSWESAMTLNGSWAYDPIPPIKSLKSLIHEMLTAASGNGNVLLSWGARFNGEWDQAQKDTLLNIGNWLKKYGTSYYGTRGGPWMPTRDYGTVYKGKKVYLYVFNWKKDMVSLPLLKDNDIQSVSILNSNENASWKKESNEFQFIKPNSTDSIVSILELTLAKPVTDILVANNSSAFDDPAYGNKIIEWKASSVKAEQNSYTINLGKTQNTTGIGIYNNAGKTTVSISTDGKQWNEVGSTTEKSTEMSITKFMTGVQVPGVPVNYIRLKVTKLSNELNVMIYAK